MQRSASKPAFRQMGIERINAEGQGFAQTFMARQQPAQLRHDGGAIS